jgi:hypothetical protein
VLATTGSAITPWELLTRMPMTPSSTAVRRPTVDEWGVYDPQQAGLAALFTRLTTTPAPRPDAEGGAPANSERVSALKPPAR